MLAYELPTSLNVGGEDCEIRTDFRAVLDILIAMDDPELDEYAKSIVVIQILYPEWRNIPKDHIKEALEKACEFIDHGHKSNGKPSPRLVDWEQDASLIIPAVNSVAHTEIRSIPNLHWWTFLGWFMEIRESLFSSVLSIRQKKAKGKKLEKYEEEFYKSNKDIIDLKKPETAEDKAMKEYFAKWL